MRRSGIYRSQTFTRKRDAQAWATEIEAQVRQAAAGGFISPKGLTVGRVIELYRKNVAGGGRTRASCLSLG